MRLCNVLRSIELSSKLNYSYVLSTHRHLETQLVLRRTAGQDIYINNRLFYCQLLGGIDKSFLFSRETLEGKAMPMPLSYVCQLRGILFTVPVYDYFCRYRNKLSAWVRGLYVSSFHALWEVSAFKITRVLRKLRQQSSHVTLIFAFEHEMIPSRGRVLNSLRQRSHLHTPSRRRYSQSFADQIHVSRPRCPLTVSALDTVI